MSWLKWAGAWTLTQLHYLFNNLAFWTVWCIAWAIFEYYALTGWWRWLIVGYFVVLWAVFTWLSRSRRKLEARRVQLAQDHLRVRNALVESLVGEGVSRQTAERIDWLIDNDQFEAAADLFTQFRREQA